MNDDTENIPGETGQSASPENQGETAPADDRTVTEESNEISETVVDVPGTEYVLEDDEDPVQETLSLTIQETIVSVGSDIVHADLFGSFLICGTLIGLFILRKVYGT